MVATSRNDAPVTPSPSGSFAKPRRCPHRATASTSPLRVVLALKLCHAAEAHDAVLVPRRPAHLHHRAVVVPRPRPRARAPTTRVATSPRGHRGEQEPERHRLAPLQPTTPPSPSMSAVVTATPTPTPVCATPRRHPRPRPKPRTVRDLLRHHPKCPHLNVMERCCEPERRAPPCLQPHRARRRARHSAAEPPWCPATPSTAATSTSTRPRQACPCRR